MHMRHNCTLAGVVYISLQTSIQLRELQSSPARCKGSICHQFSTVNQPHFVMLAQGKISQKPPFPEMTRQLNHTSFPSPLSHILPADCSTSKELNTPPRGVSEQNPRLLNSA